MSRITLPATITFNDKQITTAINGIFAQVLNEATALSIPPILQRLRIFLRSEFLFSPESRSMISGKLKGEFGFTNGEQFVVPIIDWIIDKIEVEYKPFKAIGGSFAGKFLIKLAVFEFEELYALPQSSYISFGRLIRNIEWLKWLLELGHQIIINEYSISTKVPPRYKSRSKDAVMVKNSSVYAEGQGWRVPPEFAGRPNDNWITRTILPLQTQIESLIVDEIEKHVVP